MQSETGFPSSHQLKSYVASKSRLKLAARAVLSADAGLLVRSVNQEQTRQWLRQTDTVQGVTWNQRHRLKCSVYTCTGRTRYCQLPTSTRHCGFLPMHVIWKIKNKPSDTLT